MALSLILYASLVLNYTLHQFIDIEKYSISSLREICNKYNSKLIILEIPDITGKIYKEEEVRAMTTTERTAKVQKIPCPKTYTVFNSEQIENLSELNLNFVSNDEPQENEISEIENCENFISKIIVNGNLDLRFGQKPTAFYSPRFDFVELPKREFFVSTSKYYSILFHEIIHWTGHESRLNREMKGSRDKESYSFEELIAEMGAMLCSLQFGIYEEFINSIR